jgi:hypothetical protein
MNRLAVVKILTGTLAAILTQPIASASRAQLTGRNAWGKSVDGIALAISLSSEVLTTNSDIHYAIYIGNFGSSTVWYTSCSFRGAIYFGVSVVDENGTTMPPQAGTHLVWSCSRDALIPLKPGGMDMLISGSISREWSLRPGLYVLRSQASTTNISVGNDKQKTSPLTASESFLVAEHAFSVRP